MKKLRCLFMGLLIGGVLICPAMAASSFPDVDENADYAEAVKYLDDVGIMRGDNNGNFNPNQTVTRAEMATIICNMLGETEDLTVSDTFSDVSRTHWANKYISKASEFGLVSGYGSGKFGPNDSVTYEQVLTMVVRAMALEEEAIQAGGYPDGYIEIAHERGYINRLSAQKGESLTRWQVAMILYNVAYSIL